MKNAQTTIHFFPPIAIVPITEERTRFHTSGFLATRRQPSAGDSPGRGSSYAAPWLTPRPISLITKGPCMPMSDVTRVLMIADCADSL